MAKTTFQGVVRSYGGQNKSSGVTPAPVIVGEVVSFLSSTATSTPIRVGVSASAGTVFVLPQGAIPISLAVITPSSGATSTVDIGSAANATTFGNEIVTGTAGVKTFSGPGVTGVGIASNTTVYANVGSTAGTGTVTAIFTYAVVDAGLPGEIGPA
jgi:hypothetical protein